MKGFLTISKVLLPDGTEIPTQRAVGYKWIVPAIPQPLGWGMERHEVPMGPNLFVDGGRQLMAYCFGGRSPLSSFFCQKFGFGTGTTPPAVTNVSLEAPIYLNPPTNTVITKEINGVDYPTAFIARVECAIGAADGNGYLITEMGLFSGNETLIARSTNLGINKTSDFSPVVTWRIRF